MQVALWKSCLNPVQSASLMVRSYPRYPDVLAIMNAVAESEGAPSAADLMAGGDVAMLPPARSLPVVAAKLRAYAIPCDRLSGRCDMSYCCTSIVHEVGCILDLPSQRLSAWCVCVRKTRQNRSKLGRRHSRCRRRMPSIPPRRACAARR